MPEQIAEKLDFDFGWRSGFSLRMATSKRRRRIRKMRKQTVFSDFIANGECTGLEETKKAAPFGPPFFKEANGGNQRKLV